LSKGLVIGDLGKKNQPGGGQEKQEPGTGSRHGESFFKKLTVTAQCEPVANRVPLVTAGELRQNAGINPVSLSLVVRTYGTRKKRKS
jgi:hypothetical protein